MGSSYAQQLVEDTLRRPLKPDEKLVFLDGNTANVKFGNIGILKVLQPRKPHKGGRYKSKIQPIEQLTCPNCGTTFKPNNLQIGRMLKNKSNAYCSEKCRSAFNKQKDYERRFGLIKK